MPTSRYKGQIHPVHELRFARSAARALTQCPQMLPRGALLRANGGVDGCRTTGRRGDRRLGGTGPTRGSGSQSPTYDSCQIRAELSASMAIRVVTAVANAGETHVSASPPWPVSVTASVDLVAAEQDEAVRGRCALAGNEGLSTDFK